MDEPEIVRRRDALTGLSVIALLLAVLAGTVFYRIVTPPPPGKLPPDLLYLVRQPGDASDPPANPRDAVPGSLAPLRDEQVRRATNVVESKTTPPAVEERPRFLAPAAR